MAWEIYNKTHEPINGKRLRFAGWEHATKSVNKSIEVDLISYKGITIQFGDVRYIRSEFASYQVKDTTVIVDHVPGYSNFSIPKELIEVWVSDIPVMQGGIDYNNNIDHQRCNADTLLVPGDKVYIVTRTTLRDEYGCDIRYNQNQDVSELAKPFKLVDGKRIVSLANNHHKKMRQGTYITNGHIIDNCVLLEGIGDTRILVPFEYLEVRISKVSLSERKEKNKQVVKKEQPKQITVPTDSKKENPKMELQFNAKQIMEQNKDAFLIAAKIEVGEVAVQQVTKIVKKQLPLMMKGYADLPIFEIVLANMVVMAIKQFCPENEKAQIIADAMLMASMQKQIKEFNIPKMVEEFTSNIDVSSITKLTTKEAE